MSDTEHDRPPIIRHVDDIPDLMTWEDHQQAPERKRIRFRLTATATGIEIVGDSPFPELLERVLMELDPEDLESTLCG